MRKPLRIMIALLATGCVIAGTCDYARVPYHEWRMKAANEKSRSVLAGRYSVAQDIMGLLQREPRTYQYYQKIVSRHERALVELGYLERRFFFPAHPIKASADRRSFHEGIDKVFQSSWYTYLFLTNGQSIEVTAKREDFAKWEEFIRQFEQRRARGSNNEITALRR